MQAFDLTQYGISGPQILRNLSPAVLYEEAIRFDKKTSISAYRSIGSLLRRKNRTISSGQASG